jgi:hypothetical protein
LLYHSFRTRSCVFVRDAAALPCNVGALMRDASPHQPRSFRISKLSYATRPPYGRVTAPLKMNNYAVLNDSIRASVFASSAGGTRSGSGLAVRLLWRTFGSRRASCRAQREPVVLGTRSALPPGPSTTARNFVPGCCASGTGRVPRPDWCVLRVGVALAPSGATPTRNAPVGRGTRACRRRCGEGRLRLVWLEGRDTPRYRDIKEE